MKKTYEVPELFVDEYAADTMIASANVGSGSKSHGMDVIAGDKCDFVLPGGPEIDDPIL